MILDIRHAFSDARGDLEIYSREKIVYFANIRKKVRLFDKNGNPLIRPLKKGVMGKSTLLDEDKQKSLLILARKDSVGKKYFGLRPVSQDLVYRVQIFPVDGARFLLITHDKTPIAVAKIQNDGRSLCKLYLRDVNEGLVSKLLPFVLFYLKGFRI